MGQNAFLKYLVAQVLVIVAVTGIFRFIPDRQIAATIAGILFVGLPLVLMTLEYRRAQFEESLWFVVVLQFWTVFALPILGMRLANWGIPFEQLSFLGISGPLLHQWSSKSYMAMMLVTVWSAWKSWRRRA